MTPEQWQRVKDLFQEALQWPEEERATLLAKACPSDSEVRSEVASLLRWAVEDGSAFSENGAIPGVIPAEITPVTPAGFAEPGSEIGPYRIERQIGRGGMGRVFLAEDLRLHRKVAIKVLSEKLASAENEGALILREARAIARLSHPNIASVHDVVEHAGRAHIVMEFLQGETLAERLTRGPVPLEELLRLSRQMAAGLGHAHKHSIVHCDFKPANVFITTDGVVKLLDFGLARSILAEASEESAHLGASPTLIRQRAGTPAYMSPEHRKGQPLDPRADVYSLGIVLHEMATTRRPSLPLRSQTTSETQDLLDPALPAILRPLTARALSLDPAGRFPSAVEVEAALEVIEIDRRLRSSSAHGRYGPAAAAILLVLLGGLAAFWALGSRPDVTGAKPLSSRAIVVVLPFTTASDEPTAKYLAAGLTEIVTNDLSASKELVVVSNNSVRSAVGDTRDPADAASELGATHVVSGTLQSEGGYVRIDMRVFSVQSKTLTPVTKVDVPFAQVVGKSRTMAEVIRAALSKAGLPVTIESTAATSATSDPQALEDYARGREYLDRPDTGENLDIALKLFDSALQRDPGFALVHAAISEACWRKYRSTRDAMWASRAQAAAFEAMRLAPDEPAVRYSAAIVLQGTGRAREAMEEVSRVIALQPSSEEAHRLLAQLYAEAGDIEKAIPEFQAAIELRPGSWENYHAMGVADYNKSRYDLAIAAFKRETELRPDSAAAFQALGTSYHAIGDVVQALENYQRAIAIAPSAFAYSNIGMIHYGRGRFQDAVAAYEQSAKISPREPVTYRNLGDSLMKTGDAAQARASYRQAIALAADQLRINPTRARLLTLQAVCHAKLRERAPAVKAIESALAIVPLDNQVLFQAAVVSALFGDANRAMTMLKEAVTAGYSRQLIAEEEDFATLRQRPDFKALLAPEPEKKTDGEPR